MPAGAILDLHDPEIGVEADLPCEIGLDIRIRCRLHLEAGDEGPGNRMRVIEFALRGRPEQIRRSVKPVDFHEYGAGLLRTAPPNDRIGAFRRTAAQIGGYPDA